MNSCCSFKCKKILLTLFKKNIISFNNFPASAYTLKIFTVIKNLNLTFQHQRFLSHSLKLGQFKVRVSSILLTKQNIDLNRINQDQSSLLGLCTCVAVTVSAELRPPRVGVFPPDNESVQLRLRVDKT